MGKILVIPIFIPHRGCPHDCLFCNQRKISGQTTDSITPRTVAETIDQWLGRRQHRSLVQVAFYGGSFTCLPVEEQVELLQAVEPYIRARQVETIRLSTRPDCLDQGICDLLRKYRVGVVELGVQSFSDTVLKRSRRGHSAEQARRAIQLLQQARLQVGVQLMPGLPGETTRSFLRGIDELIELRPTMVRLYPALVVKDSGLAELYREARYRPLSLNKAIALTGRCYEKLTGAGIRVVRMGLQPATSLEEGLLAGPYHPAFGELVHSRLWLKRIRARLAGLQPREKLVIRISPKEMSAVTGMKRGNIKRLDELGFAGRYTILQEKNMARGCVEYAVC